MYEYFAFKKCWLPRKGKFCSEIFYYAKANSGLTCNYVIYTLFSFDDESDLSLMLVQQTCLEG